MKKFVCLILSLVMVISLVNMNVSAENGADVVYYASGIPEHKVTGLVIGETYTPERIPDNIPDGKNFIGWRDDNGNFIGNDGFLLNNETNNLYAVFNDKYLMNKNAVILNSKCFEDNKIQFPYTYNDNYYHYIDYEVNGGYGPKEFIYYGEDAPYTRFTSGQYNGKGVAWLFDNNGVALKGEWNKTYEITVEYRIPSIETRIHLQPVFGFKKDFAQGVGADKLNEGRILRTGHTSSLTRRWDYNLVTGYEYWFSKNSADSKDYNILESGFNDWRSVTYTVKTGEENADYLPIFGIHVNVGAKNNANALEIKNITVTGEYNSDVRYVANGEVVSVAENVESGSLYTVDYAAENTDSHYFEGWYFDADSKMPAPPSFIFEEKTTLYAKMTEYKKSASVYLDNEILYEENGEQFTVKPDTEYKVTLEYTFDNSLNNEGYAQLYLETGFNKSESLRLRATQSKNKVIFYITTPKLSAYIDNNFLQVLSLNTFVSENCNLDIKGIEVKQINPLLQGGVSMLKTESANETQALRFYFAYDTTNGENVFFGNSQYEVVSRGILISKGISGENEIEREDADSKYVYDINTTELYKCWNVKSYDDAKEQLCYSACVSGIKAINGDYNDTERFYARGYIVCKKGVNLYTEYSDPLSYTVKEVAVLNAYHNEGNYTLTNDKKRNLVWNLEFENETDTKQLDDRLNTGVHAMAPDWDVLRFANDEEHYFLKDGALVLRLTKDEATNKFKTAPSLTTVDRMSFKYGYLEMRAKLDYGHYMFYSWWMQPDKKLLPENFRYYGEIDIFETWWQARGLTFSVGKWYDGYKGAVGQYSTGTDVSKHEGNYKFTFPKDVNLKNEYHIYGFEWTPEYLKAYVDGYCYYTIYIDEANDYSEEYPGMECFHDYYYLCWNNWMYITHAEETKLENGYADYAIDYVRLYQNENEDIVVY